MDHLPHLIDICHRLYGRGYVTATDGNVSIRLQNGNILTTRSGINKGTVGHDDFVEVGLDGRKVKGAGKASTEVGMHVFIYRHRPDVHAVVHAHPVHATGFATARIPLTDCLFPEVIVGMGAVPLAEYATPSTGEVSESLAPFVRSADAVLLANHGVVTYGPDLDDAYFKMEKVEHAAHITFVARLLGGEKPLTETELGKLRQVSVESYGRDFTGKPSCATSPPPEEMSEEDLRKHIRRILTERGL